MDEQKNQAFSPKAKALLTRRRPPRSWWAFWWRVWYQATSPFRAISETLSRVFTIYRVALLLGCLAIALSYYNRITFKELLPNIITDLLGVALAVFIVDTMYRLRSNTERKKVLITKLGSKNNAVASEALRELDAEGWLSDGSLVRAYLSSSNLDGNTFTGADLRRASFSFASLRDTTWFEANLQGAFLDYANLTNAALSVHAIGSHFAEADLTDATLIYTNLKGATVRHEQLCRARTLWRTTMPDGGTYNGCYNLKQDIEDYMRFAIDPTDPTDWAQYYGVTPARYLEGQEWAKINLEKLRKTVSA